MSMKSRFVVGHKYAFAFFNVFGNETFDVISLECVDERVVSIEYYENDPTQKTYGYKFKDKKGKFWYNQYNRASYGQVSMEADWMVYNYEDLMVFTEAGKFLDAVARVARKAPFTGATDESAEKAQKDLIIFKTLIEEKGFSIKLEEDKIVFNDGRVSTFNFYKVTENKNGQA